MIMFIIPGREGTRWDQVLQTLVLYRLKLELPEQGPPKIQALKWRTEPVVK